MTRSVHSRITFAAPFSLKGVYGEHPAGTYSISTRSRPVWDFPFSWRLKAVTEITICAGHGVKGSITQYHVCPRDLDRALTVDRAAAA